MKGDKNTGVLEFKVTLKMTIFQTYWEGSPIQGLMSAVTHPYLWNPKDREVVGFHLIPNYGARENSKYWGFEGWGSKCVSFDWMLDYWAIKN